MDKIQEDIIADFAMFDDWMDKYNYLIELGSAMPPIDDAHRTERYAISGCQSRVWLAARLSDEGGVYFSADSDAIITKGIISLLIKVMNGRTPREILDTDLYFIDRVGLRENLSPTRANGLAAMVKQMKMYALAFDAQKVNREE
jgi:cysteine desulfuration protein SufE